MAKVNIDQYLDRNYQCCGNVHELQDGLQFYQIGDTSSGKGMIIISDLMGWNTGRTRALADFMGQNGYYTVVPRLLRPTKSKGASQTQEHEEEDSNFPNLFDFSQLGDFMRRWTYDSTLKPKMMSLIQHFESVGINKLALLGFSWGSWVGAHVLADPDLQSKFKSGIFVTPSLQIEEQFFGGNVNELINKIQVPVMFVPAKGDPNEYREGGAWYENLKRRCNQSHVIDCNKVEHGFLPRSSVHNNRDNYECVKGTMECALNFLNKVCV